MFNLEEQKCKLHFKRKKSHIDYRVWKKGYLIK